MGGVLQKMITFSKLFLFLLNLKYPFIYHQTLENLLPIETKQVKIKKFYIHPDNLPR